MLPVTSTAPQAAPPLSAPHVDGAAVWRKLRWRLLPPLFFVSLCCQLDRSNLSFAALQMRHDLPWFSRSVQGLGSGLFFIGYLAQIPANLACVALGPRRWLPLILLAWGAVAACFAAVRGTASFLALRLLLGVAEAGAYPCIMYYLSLFYPQHHLGLAFSMVATATAAAGLAGGPLAAGIMSLEGAAGLRGWQWLFLLEGVPPLLLAAVLPHLLPSGPLTARFLQPAEQRWLWREVSGGRCGDVELTQLTVTEQEAEAGKQGADADCMAAGAAVAAAATEGEPPAGPAAADGGPDGERNALLGAHHKGGTAEAQACSSPPGGSSSSSRGTAGMGLRAAARAGLCDRRVWHLALVMLLIDINMNAVNFWLPTLVKATLQGRLQSDSGGSSSSSDSDSGSSTSGSGSSGSGSGSSSGSSLYLLIKASLLTALPFCGAAVCMVANAHHSKRHHERRLHTALPMLAAGAAFALLPLASSAGPVPAIAALTVAASGIWATHGPLFSWPSAFLDPKAAALGFALVKTGGAVGGFLGPAAIGWMADALHGYTAAMLMLGGVAAAAAAMVCVFDDAA